MLWAQNDIRGRQLGQYIREEIEGEMGRWENFYRSRLSAETVFGGYPLSILAPGGAFIISEVVAIIFLVFYAVNSSKERWILLVH